MVGISVVVRTVYRGVGKHGATALHFASRRKVVAVVRRNFVVARTVFDWPWAKCSLCPWMGTRWTLLMFRLVRIGWGVEVGRRCLGLGTDVWEDPSCPAGAAPY